MNADRHARIESLCHAALARPADARAAFLEEACGGDVELRMEVESLLEQAGRGDGFLSSPPAAPNGLRLPERIGGYRILSQLGEGAFGIVYVAEQIEPVRRRVALKIIKPGMDSTAVLARFEAERQALAVMDHPSVAKVYDGGKTAEGRPFFVMDLVQGLPITEHCNRHRLGLEERIELFIQVCHAVQHAHMKGVIHRDLKPSNILVKYEEGPDGPRATSKVIDFGVAKALNQRLSERTIFTHLGLMIGTPEYMSPEQADMSGQDIDTRADIYSLGVVLYELLTGMLPFDVAQLRQAGFGELQRIIREIDPPRPSTRLSTGRVATVGGAGAAESAGSSSESAIGGHAVAAIAHQRRTDARTLLRTLRGDLDWVVMKCLEKDRVRRYDTANALAAELRRFLRHEPVLAGPPSAGYRLRKFVRRNRAPVAAAATSVAVLLGGIAGIALALAEAQRRGEELARVAEFQASQLADIDAALMGTRLRAAIVEKRRAALTRTVHGAAEIERGLLELDASLVGINFTNVALESLDENIFERALQAINERFGSQPLVQARLLQTVALTMRNLGLLERATAPQKQALEIRQRTLGNEHPDTLASTGHLVDLLHAQDRIGEMEPYAQKALDARVHLLGDEPPDTLESTSHAGELLLHQGRLAEAESYSRRALEGRRRVLGDEHPDTLKSVRQLLLMLARQGKMDAEVEALATSALEGRRRTLGDDHPDTIESLRDMGEFLLEQNKVEEAERFLREALEASRRVLGDEHSSTLESISEMGLVMLRQAQIAESEALLREAVSTARHVLGDEHATTLHLMGNLGIVLRRQGKLVEAEHYARMALETRRRVSGNEHPDTLNAMSQMSWLLASQDRHQDAESLMYEVLETRRRLLGAHHMLTLDALHNMGDLLQSLGRYDEAERYWRELLEGRRRLLGNEDRATLEALSNVGFLLGRQGRQPEAEPYFREALEAYRRVLGNQHLSTVTAMSNMGAVLRELGRFEEAERLLAEAVQAQRAARPVGHPSTAISLAHYGRTLTALRRFAEGETALLEAHGTFESALGRQHERTTGAMEALIELYEAWHAAAPDHGHGAKAVKWRALRGTAAVAVGERQ